MAFPSKFIPNVIVALADVKAGKEFCAAIDAGAILSPKTFIRLTDAMGSKTVAQNIQAAMLCQRSLSLHDQAVMEDGFASDDVMEAVVASINAHCAIPVHRGPALVNLGSASNYRMLAESGISNASGATVTGNIAVSPISHTAITGFTYTPNLAGPHGSAVEVSGNVDASDNAAPTPANLTAAVSAMQAAYTFAQAQTSPAPVVNLGAGTLNGQTLTPGIYKWSTAVDVTGDITINGGPADSIILQIAGTLNLETGVQIHLTGGILPQNVTWAVAGATTLKTSSIFRGVILDQTSIAVQATCTVHGSLYAQTAVTLISGNTGP
jgi:hypothetical protein